MGQITFHCPHCGQELTVGEHKAGKEGRCGNCGAVVVVPGATEMADEEDSSERDLPEIESIEEGEDSESTGQPKSSQMDEILEEFSKLEEYEEKAEAEEAYVVEEADEEEGDIPEAEIIEEEEPVESASGEAGAAGMGTGSPPETTPVRASEEEGKAEEGGPPAESATGYPGGLAICSVVSGALGIATVWFWGIGTLFGTVAIGCHLYQRDRRSGWGLFGAILGSLALVLGVCYAGWQVLSKT